MRNRFELNDRRVASKALIRTSTRTPIKDTQMSSSREGNEPREGSHDKFGETALSVAEERTEAPLDIVIVIPTRFSASEEENIRAYYGLTKALSLRGHRIVFLERRRAHAKRDSG